MIQRTFPQKFLTLLFVTFILLSVSSLWLHTDVSQAADSWRSKLYPQDWTPVDAGGAKDAQGRFLHDFSYAGYHRGEVAIPSNPPGKTYDVTQHPYRADSSGVKDSTTAIQQAIDDAGKAGGGIVYLPAGTYRIKPQSDNPYSLWINQSGVVLRGDGPDQTFLFNDTTSMRKKNILLVAPQTYSDWYAPIDTPVAITADLLEPTRIIPVKRTDSYRVGEWVVLREDATDALLREVYADWLGHDQTLKGPVFYRQITAVYPEKSTIEIDIPTRFPLTTRDQARVYRVKDQITEFGIERLSIGNRQHTHPDMGDDSYDTPGTGAYDVHFSDGIHIRYALNGWVDQVSTYRPSVNKDDVHLLSDGIEIYQSRSLTIQRVHIQKPQYQGNGGNGYGLVIRSSDSLIRDSILNNNRHNFSFKSMWTSGNVVYRTQLSDSRMPADYHMHLSMANLIDNAVVSNDYLAATNRGGYGTVPHGVTTTESVFWNTTGRSYFGKRSSIIESRQHGIGYVIGTQGEAEHVLTDEDDWLEGVGLAQSLTPQSLYLDQLARRLGSDSPWAAQSDIPLLLDETFEDQQIGKSPAKWQIGGGGGSALVEATSKDGIENSLRLNDTNRLADIRAQRTFAPLSRPLTLEFAAKVDDKDMVLYVGSLYQNNSRAVTVLFDSNGQLAYYDGKQKKSLQPYAAQTWYHFKIVADPDTQSFDLYVDDKERPVVRHAKFSSDVSSLNRLSFQTSASGVGGGNVSNVRLY